MSVTIFYHIFTEGSGFPDDKAIERRVAIGALVDADAAAVRAAIERLKTATYRSMGHTGADRFLDQKVYRGDIDLEHVSILEQ